MPSPRSVQTKHYLCITWLPIRDPSDNKLTSPLPHPIPHPIPHPLHIWWCSDLSLPSPGNDGKGKAAHLSKAFREGDREENIPALTRKKERKRSEIIADIREECMKIDRKWRSRLRRLYEWTLHLVSLWSHPSFDQKASGQREGRPASKGREEGGEDDGEAVIFNSLPPVKSAGKVIRPASPPPPLLLLLSMFLMQVVAVFIEMPAAKFSTSLLCFWCTLWSIHNYQQL